MNQWKEYKLGEIITFQRGHDLPKSEMKNGSYAVAGSNGIIGYHNKFTTKGECITIGRSGNIGVPHYYKNDFWAHNTTLYVREFHNSYPKFVYYFLKTIDFTQFNAGSAVPTLNRNHIHELSFKIPPLPEQRAIASVLSSLDDKIDLLHRQNATLEALAETLFRQWFVEEAEESWEDGEIYLLEDLIETISQTFKFKSDKVVFLNTSDISAGQVLQREYSDVIGLPGQAKKSIRKNDILFSEIRPANKRFAFVDFDASEFVVSTKLMVLRSKGVVSQAIIYFYLTHPQTLAWLQMIAESRSGTFPQITFDQLKTMKINLPTGKKLEEMTFWVENTLRKISNNHTQIRTLTQLRDTLLPKLMSGEVRVKI